MKNSEHAYILAEQVKELYKMISRQKPDDLIGVIKITALAGQMNAVADIVISQPHEGDHLGKQEEGIEKHIEEIMGIHTEVSKLIEDL